ncbi:integrase arm-type DNA-binding domain-containing protein [Rhodoferax sp. TBRC 17198]|jgi:integrase|uniref:tyrosine-type recombinase/integrase n=1 Tax=Rhodoferax potami TaxID=3068338 RepID=UPI0028BEA7C0|nr:integrase arm-type DNA-binding domain-containing protein [Rhodoferax sp. TBRC 17198]MDT7521062.1 integrase arm-type DNA-binding domain-containing protein [Rhodoferax sp. TBRC 17198]
MAIHKLTDPKIKAKIREIQDLAFSAPKNALVGDGQGLYLSIAKNGTASWLYRYMDHGKAKSVGLGGYPGTTLQKAREKAQALRDARTGGVDPMTAKREAEREKKLQQAKSKTFQTCAEEYIALTRSSWKNAKHAQQWENTLQKIAYPVIGQMPIGAVHASDVVKVLKPIWTSTTETAMRLRGRIESVIDWATAHGMREGDNPARFKGYLEHLLPKLRDSDRHQHHPALPYEELPAFLLKLNEQSGMARYALEFLILCASRTGEVIEATWDELDLDKGIWVIRKERMKAGIEHRVPLGKRALEVLTLVRPFSGAKYVFAGRKKESPLSNMAMSMLIRRMGYADITVHGMRSTFRNWAGEQTTYPFEVCEQALAHRLPDAVAAAYLRTDFYDKRVGLLSDWERFCLSERMI